jgi:hypothetical protein
MTNVQRVKRPQRCEGQDAEADNERMDDGDVSGRITIGEEKQHAKHEDEPAHLFQPGVLLEKASFEERSMYGLLPGEVGTDDAPRPPYNLEVYLTLRGTTLAGAATTRELRTGERGALLPYWMELKRTPR